MSILQDVSTHSIECFNIVSFIQEFVHSGIVPSGSISKDPGSLVGSVSFLKKILRFTQRTEDEKKGVRRPPLPSFPNHPQAFPHPPC